jgi:hypothetical protein
MKNSKDPAAWYQSQGLLQNFWKHLLARCRAAFLYSQESKLVEPEPIHVEIRVV